RNVHAAEVEDALSRRIAEPGLRDEPPEKVHGRIDSDEVRGCFPGRGPRDDVAVQARRDELRLRVAAVDAENDLHGRRAPTPHSPYTPIAALAGALVLAIALEAVGSLAGSTLRSGLRLPPLRAIDSAGGFVLGAASGLAVVWVLGAAALLLPGQTTLRHTAQRSLVVRRFDAIAPPRRLLEALARVDPFPSIAGPIAGVAPPDPRLLSAPGVRAAAPSVVRVLGTACGLAVEGSGWVARPGLVVTAAHVVAGERDTTVEPPGLRSSLPATPVFVDAHNDVAVLRVPGLT